MTWQAEAAERRPDVVIVADHVFDVVAGRGVRDVFTVSGGGIMYLLDALGRNPDLRLLVQLPRAGLRHRGRGLRARDRRHRRLPGDDRAGQRQRALRARGRVARLGARARHLGSGAHRPHRRLPQAPADRAAGAQHHRHGQAGDQVRRDRHERGRRAGPARAGDRARHLRPARPGLAEHPARRPGARGAVAAARASPPARRASQAPGCPGPERDAARCSRLLRAVAAPGRSWPATASTSPAPSASSRASSTRSAVPWSRRWAAWTCSRRPIRCYLGRFGPTGQRRANFTLQNADLLLCLGTSMSVSSVGFDTERLAPHALRVMVNIDADEMAKPQFRADHRVACRPRAVPGGAARRSRGADIRPDPRWLEAVARWKRDYPIVTADYFDDADHVNSYVLADRLSEAMQPGEVLLTGNGTDAVSGAPLLRREEGPARHHQLRLRRDGLGPARGGRRLRRPRRGEDGPDDRGRQHPDEHPGAAHHRPQPAEREDLRAEQPGLREHPRDPDRVLRLAVRGVRPRVRRRQPRLRATSPQPTGWSYRLFRTNADLSAGLAEVMDSDGPWLCEVNVSPTQEKAPRIKSRQTRGRHLRVGAAGRSVPVPPEGGAGGDHERVRGHRPVTVAARCAARAQRDAGRPEVRGRRDDRAASRGGPRERERRRRLPRGLGGDRPVLLLRRVRLPARRGRRAGQGLALAAVQTPRHPVRPVECGVPDRRPAGSGAAGASRSCRTRFWSSSSPAPTASSGSCPCSWRAPC